MPPPELTSSSSTQEVVDYFNFQWLLGSDNGQLSQVQQTALDLLQTEGIDGKPLSYLFNSQSLVLQAITFGALNHWINWRKTY
jgi:hypothetical protein